VKAIKVSAKLIGGRSPAAPAGQADGATPAWTPESKIDDQLGTGQ
jgi:hypothetical protein